MKRCSHHGMVSLGSVLGAIPVRGVSLDIIRSVEESPLDFAVVGMGNFAVTAVGLTLFCLGISDGFVSFKLFVLHHVN